MSTCKRIWLTDESRRRCENHLRKKASHFPQNVAIRGGKNRWLISDRHNKRTLTVRKEQQCFNCYEIQTELATHQRLYEALILLSTDSKASEVYHLLKPYSIEALIFALMQPEQPKWRSEKIEDYLINLRKIEPFNQWIRFDSARATTGKSILQISYPRHSQPS